MPVAPRRGTVYLVGAGPGDPGLITVKGLNVLRAADVVIYDRLVSPELLTHVPGRAERIFAGKHPGDHCMSQAQINAVMIARARSGATVVRLKGGDPFVLGRGGEECEALAAAGIPFEVIPGVTSAVAVPAYAGIPVTHRRYASAFAVVTGHECDGSPDLDWQALARVPTLVVLMGARRLPEIARRLVECGLDPSTPAAAVAQGTTPRQRTVVGTLEGIHALVREAALESPTILIIGQVVRLGAVIGWFEEAGRSFEAARRAVGP